MTRFPHLRFILAAALLLALALFAPRVLVAIAADGKTATVDKKTAAAAMKKYDIAPDRENPLYL